jgi:hypothetical protein
MSFKDAFMQEFRFFKQFNMHVKTMQRKSSSQIDSAEGSNDSQSRGRSRSFPNNNHNNIIANETLRMSSKSLNKSLKSLKENKSNRVHRVESENLDLI